MKQIYHSTGYITNDLTECRVSRLVDSNGVARFVASFPSKWTEGERVERKTPSGNTVSHRPYTVTEWTEVELAIKSDEAQ
jgi:hypothetical protein